MSETTTTCPKCKEVDLPFQVEHISADDGQWYSAGLITDERECDCEFTDAELEALETSVANDYTEGVYSYES